MHEIGNVARIGQTISQRSLVNQNLRAAIGQHIGDLGFLLTRREQHRDEAGMGRGKYRQHEFDAVAEQHRDAVAALQAELFETGRNLRGVRDGLAPCHPPLAADQCLAVRIFRGGLQNHRPDVFRPLAKHRHQAVAETRLEPHRRNGMF